MRKIKNRKKKIFRQNYEKRDLHPESMADILILSEEERIQGKEGEKSPKLNLKLPPEVFWG